MIMLKLWAWSERLSSLRQGGKAERITIVARQRSEGHPPSGRSERRRSATHPRLAWGGCYSGSAQAAS